MIIGIDPGKTGAIAVFDRAREAVHDIPATVEMVFDLINGMSPDIAVIELQHPRPGNAVASSAAMMRGYGELLGILASQGTQVYTVRPQAWKRHLGLIGQDKKASLSLARELFPSLQDRLLRQKDHGRAEALLIGHAGIRLFNL